MAINRGKQFETVVKDCFQKVPHTAVVRLHDQTTGFVGSSNICDFIVYHYPNQYFIECKSVHGNTLPFSNITDNQWQGMLEMSKIHGVWAGVVCWWCDHDVTKFIPIDTLEAMRKADCKSVRYDLQQYIADRFIYSIYNIEGKKKRIFFDYDMDKFFKDVRG